MVTSLCNVYNILKTTVLISKLVFSSTFCTLLHSQVEGGYY